MENTEQHLFADKEYQLVQASAGKRFANYIIDLVGFYALLFVVGIVIGLLNPPALESFNEESGDYNIGQSLLFVLIFILYISGMEAIFKGKTLGKLMTGTRAVNEDGSNLLVGTAFLRGLCRAIPFEAFSALGTPSYPWHDKLSKSYVIDEKESNRPGI
ncbi:MAG: RDD family protein [Chitinophagaceae bacterium]